jgi:hypothetical protein
MTTKKTKPVTHLWYPSEVSEKQYKNPSKVETEYDTRKYEKTYNIIYRVSCLSMNMFQVRKKKELITELQNTIKKLNELLLELKNEEKGK